MKNIGLTSPSQFDVIPLHHYAVMEEAVLIKRILFLVTWVNPHDEVVAYLIENFGIRAEDAIPVIEEDVSEDAYIILMNNREEKISRSYFQVLQWQDLVFL